MEALKVLGAVFLVLLALGLLYWYVEVYTVRKHWREATEAVKLQRNLFPPPRKNHNMPVANIALDSWKLDIFQRHLTQAGYKCPEAKPLIAGTLLLTIQTDNLEALQQVVQAANQEAALTGAPTT